MSNQKDQVADELASLREQIKKWKPSMDRLDALDPKMYREEIINLRRESVSANPYKQNDINRRITRLHAQLALLEHILCL